MRLSRRFADRTEAGKELAKLLLALKLDDPVVLALPRGGVPVAVEIARALKAPLDLILVRKIGVPFQRELAVAAVVDGGEAEIVVNDEVMTVAGVTQDYITEQTRIELDEIERRRRVYLEGRPRVPLDGRNLILVDDGIASLCLSRHKRQEQNVEDNAGKKRGARGPIERAVPIGDDRKRRRRYQHCNAVPAQPRHM